VLLTTYGLGLGIPFVLAGVGMARAFRTLSFLRRFLRPINVGSGLLLAAFGVLMITGGFNTVRSLVADFFYNTPFLSDLEF
jgi:cytochrome c-type biogenesis protein